MNRTVFIYTLILLILDYKTMITLDLKDGLKNILKLPYSSSRVNKIKDLIRQADCINNCEMSYKARIQLVEDIILEPVYGDPKDAVIAMSWCLHYTDYNIGYASQEVVYEQLYYYKPLIASFVQYEYIPLETIELFLEDYRKRILAAGYSESSYYYLAMECYIRMFNISKAKEMYQKHITFNRDRLSDCQLCILDEYLRLNCILGNMKRAEKIANDFVINGYKCDATPISTYNQMILYCTLNNNHKLAEKYRALVYPMIKNDPFYTSAIGDHLLLYSAVDVEAGLDLFVKHHPWSLRKYISAMDVYKFSRGAVALFSKYTKANIKLKLNTTFSLHRNNSIYDVKELVEYYYKKAYDLAKEFDLRNGNDTFVNQLNHFI